MQTWSRLSTLVCLGILSITGLGSAQECPAGLADTIPNNGDALDGMALPWTVPQVRVALREVMRRLKYETIAPVSDTGAIETKPSFRFPDDPATEKFRHYRHPGIVVRAFVRSEADSARVFVFARAICRVAEAPPPGFTVPVESTLELLAAQEIAFGVVERLRQEHPRRRF